MISTERPSLRSLLHDKHPFAQYTELREAGADPLRAAWGGTDAIFTELVEQYRPAQIIEVGSWYGASAITMASAARDLGLASEIVCVDTWLGDASFYMIGRHKPEFFGDLADAYRAFRRNVLSHGLEEMIVPFRLPSSEAAKVLKKLRYNAGLIYIDGSHEREAVRADLNNYWPRLAPGGHLFGHDYQMPSVKLAVQEFAREKGLEIEEIEGSGGATFWRLFA